MPSNRLPIIFVAAEVLREFEIVDSQSDFGYPVGT